MATAHPTLSPAAPTPALAQPAQTLRGIVWRQLRRDRAAMFGLAVIGILVLAAILAEQISPYPFAQQFMNKRLEGPSAANWLGTDQFGRDVLTRILYGARISLSVGLISVGIALVIGMPIGAAAGYFGKTVDLVLMFVMDVMIAFPALLLAIAIAATLGPNIQNAMIAIGIVEVPRFARLVRSSVLAIRNTDYVEAARAIGATPPRIIGLHVLPNILALVIVRATLGIGFAILTEAGLSFLGLGAQPPFPSWGGMLNEGREFLRRAQHMTIIPGFFIGLSVLAFNLLGDGLRDALDPRMKS